MRQRPKALGFAILLAPLAALHVGSPAQAASVALKCRRACHDRIAACVAAGGRRGPCGKSMLGRCKREGVAVCRGQAGATTTSTTMPTATTSLVEGGFLSGLVTDPTLAFTEPETPRPAYEHVNVDPGGTDLMWFDLVSCTKTRSCSLPLAADYGISSGEGNPSNDGRFVLIAGTRQIYVVDMDPQAPFAPYPHQRIGPALDVSSGGSMDWAGMSASGKYAIVSYNGDYPRVFDVNTSTLALTPHPMSTSYQCHGSASDGYIYALGHADVAVNPFDNNEDVLVGRDQCFPSSGQVNGVVVSNVMMARLRDGQITALTDPNNEAFASHVSTRNINRPGWAYVDYEVENGKRFSAEVIAVKLDGSKAVQRFAQEHSAFSGCYRREPHASPSPDGRRLIFASNWADHCTTCGSSSDIKDYVIDARPPYESDPRFRTDGAERRVVQVGQL